MARRDIVVELMEESSRGVLVSLMTCPSKFLFFLRKDHPRFDAVLAILKASLEQRTEADLVMDGYSIEDAVLTGRRWDMR